MRQWNYDTGREYLILMELISVTGIFGAYLDVPGCELDLFIRTRELGLARGVSKRSGLN